MVDLGSPVPVRLQNLPPALRGADAVELRLSMLGVPLVPSSRTDLVRTSATSIGADLDVDANQYLAAGRLDAEVVLLQGDEVLASEPFEISAARDWYLTVPGGLLVAAVLFVLSYTEALLRPMRKRGRRRVSGFLGMGVIGAALGVLAVAAACLLDVQSPTVPTLVGCAAAGLLTGLVIADTTARSGRRARLRRVARMQSLTG